jgi:glycolate oxidase iron-sulfur subunit
VSAPLPQRSFLPDDLARTCIHCGLCLSSCPTYLETGNENYSPRGRIYLMRALEDGVLPLDASTVQPIDLCLGCRACEAVCPSGVQYGALLEATREHIEHTYTRSLPQRLLRDVLIDRVFPYARRLRAALLPGRLARALGLTGLTPTLVRPLLDLLPEHTTVAEVPVRTPARGQRIGTVGFVRGCVMSVLFSGTNASSVSLLSKAGFDVIAPEPQGCCGALHAHSGKLEEARASARALIATFEAYQVDAIVINAAGCGSTLKEYGHLLADDPAWAPRAAAFAAKVRDLSEVLVEAGFVDRLQPAAEGPRVTFHDACHLAHAQRVTAAPRLLVKKVAGGQFVDLPEADVCCGSAGTYNVTEPEMAKRLQARKVANVRQTGAAIVVSTNPGCLMQIQAGLRDGDGAPVEVLHLADYLERWGRT